MSIGAGYPEPTTVLLLKCPQAAPALSFMICTEDGVCAHWLAMPRGGSVTSATLDCLLCVCVCVCVGCDGADFARGVGGVCGLAWISKYFVLQFFFFNAAPSSSGLDNCLVGALYFRPCRPSFLFSMLDFLKLSLNYLLIDVL